MKKLFKLLCLPALILLAASCGKNYESVPNDPTGTRIYTLDNGMKVFMSVNKDEPRVVAYVAVKVGSKNDPHETTGLAHYLEHLMFKGTEHYGTQNYAEEKPLLDQIEVLFEKYRKLTDKEERAAVYRQIDSIAYLASKISIPNEYDKLMAGIGASGSNAYTSYDQTVYVENFPANEIENWAKIQSDRFRYSVIRGFHTELETVYEEKNMSLTSDSEKAHDTMLANLFKKHPYGLQTTLGSQEHLKNPSITNIKNYKKNWYVPNNMAICISGDLDPDQTIKIIEKYFSPMKPNPNIKRLEYEAEDPITEPIVSEVYGNASPSITIAWRFPAPKDKDANRLELMSSILSNGTAGLIDINVNQEQKVLSLRGSLSRMADYSVLSMKGEPYEGQSLDEVKKIMLEQVELLKKGEFDESLMKGVVNNLKLREMKNMERAGGMVSSFVSSFINDIPWSRILSKSADMAKLTKEDVVAYANENLKNNYTEVRKLQKPDPNVIKIEKPHITPIFLNRDTASQFLRDIQASKVTPIEPVFVDFKKDLSLLKGKSDIDVLYKQNVTNDAFQLTYLFETGTENDNALQMAVDYLKYLGTDKTSPTQVKKNFYETACTFNVTTANNQTRVEISGLSENMEKAMKMAEDLLANAAASPKALKALKESTLQQRDNSKKNQSANFSRLKAWGEYGPENQMNSTILSKKEIQNLSDEDLLGRLHQLLSLDHDILYYGPKSESELLSVIEKNHNVPAQLTPVKKETRFAQLKNTKNEVLVAPFESNQIHMATMSNVGENFGADMIPMVTLYNKYFGSGMGSVVFQEMREARGLAYSSKAVFVLPENKDLNNSFTTFIATQNDKMMDAINAFNEIINNMPVSQNSFNIAKESILTNLRTKRVNKAAVLDYYLTAKRAGRDYDINKVVFEKIQGYELKDLVKFQQTVIKNRPAKTCILGDPATLDMKSLEKVGRITRLSTDEIFGY